MRNRSFGYVLFKLIFLLSSVTGFVFAIAYFIHEIIDGGSENYGFWAEAFLSGGWVAIPCGLILVAVLWGDILDYFENRREKKDGKK